MVKLVKYGCICVIFILVGFVCCGLIDVGFVMKKVKGFGIKCEMIAGSLSEKVFYINIVFEFCFEVIYGL